MKEALNKGEFYTTIKIGDFQADVYKHATANYLYVVDLYGYEEQLTTAVNARSYRKELDVLFFNPIANDVWNEHGVFEAIRKCRVVA